jgi:hypothetical protein
MDLPPFTLFDTMPGVNDKNKVSRFTLLNS